MKLVELKQKREVIIWLFYLIVIRFGYPTAAILGERIGRRCRKPSAPILVYLPWLRH